MAEPVKSGRTWRHRVMVNGKRVTGTFPTKSAAMKWEALQRAELVKEPGPPITATCRDAFRRYEIEVSKKKRGYRWEAMRLAAMAASPLGAVRIADLDASHIATWRDGRLQHVQGSTSCAS